MTKIKDSIENTIILNDSHMQPTDLAINTRNALWAESNKYRKILLINKNIGKWVLFFEKKDVNQAWNKVRIAIAKKELWKAEIKRTTNQIIKNHGVNFKADFVLIIYTRNYYYVRDAIGVLDYLEAKGIKVPHETIYFQNHNQKKGRKKDNKWIDSNQIRNHDVSVYGEIIWFFCILVLPILLIIELSKWIHKKLKKKK